MFVPFLGHVCLPLVVVGMCKALSQSLVPRGLDRKLVHFFVVVIYVKDKKSKVVRDVKAILVRTRMHCVGVVQVVNNHRKE
jgi:hypothetical protein